MIKNDCCVVLRGAKSPVSCKPPLLNLGTGRIMRQRREPDNPALANLLLESSEHRPLHRDVCTAAVHLIFYSAVSSHVSSTTMVLRLRLSRVAGPGAARRHLPKYNIVLAHARYDADIQEPQKRVANLRRQQDRPR